MSNGLKKDGQRADVEGQTASSNGGKFCSNGLVSSCQASFFRVRVSKKCTCKMCKIRCWLYSEFPNKKRVDCESKGCRCGFKKLYQRKKVVLVSE